jgi:hypothetical protein
MVGSISSIGVMLRAAFSSPSARILTIPSFTAARPISSAEAKEINCKRLPFRVRFNPDGTEEVRCGGSFLRGFARLPVLF